MRLVVDCGMDRYKFRIYWAEDGDIGGHLCQSESDGTGPAPTDRDAWEHWAASAAVRSSTGAMFDGSGLYFDSACDAIAAKRVANLALKQDRPIPEWAKQALAAGWKPPKNWKA